MLELVPLSDQNQRVGLLGHLIGVLTVDDAIQHALGIGNCLRVVGLDLCSLVLKHVDDANGRRIAHVIGVRLESEAQKPDGLATESSHDIA